MNKFGCRRCGVQYWADTEGCPFCLDEPEGFALCYSPVRQYDSWYVRHPASAWAMAHNDEIACPWPSGAVGFTVDDLMHLLRDIEGGIGDG